MIEIWLTIEGLENYYAFSNYGRIYDYKKQKYVCGTLNKKTGYYERLLIKNRKIVKGGGIHKFIYEAFKGKIPKGMEINHIDCDKSNNAIWNLSLVSHSQNRKWNTKKVLQYTLNGKLVAEYDSALIAEQKTGFHRHCISRNCRGKRKTYCGYVWKYKEVA